MTELLDRGNAIPAQVDGVQRRSVSSAQAGEAMDGVESQAQSLEADEAGQAFDALNSVSRQSECSKAAKLGDPRHALNVVGRAVQIRQVREDFCELLAVEALQVVPMHVELLDMISRIDVLKNLCHGANALPEPTNARHPQRRGLLTPSLSAWPGFVPYGLCSSPTSRLRARWLLTERPRAPPHAVHGMAGETAQGTASTRGDMLRSRAQEKSVRENNIQAAKGASNHRASVGNGLLTSPARFPRSRCGCRAHELGSQGHGQDDCG